MIGIIRTHFLKRYVLGRKMKLPEWNVGQNRAKHSEEDPNLWPARRTSSKRHYFLNLIKVCRLQNCNKNTVTESSICSIAKNMRFLCFTLHKQVKQPGWTYGAQPRKYARKCNIVVFCIQRFQNKVLNNPWYAFNKDIHRDLGVKTVASIIRRYAISHENRLQHHVYEEASRLLNVKNSTRFLKRTNPSWLDEFQYHSIKLKQINGLYELVFVLFKLNKDVFTFPFYI